MIFQMKILCFKRWVDISMRITSLYMQNSANLTDDSIHTNGGGYFSKLDVFLFSISGPE